MKNISRLLMLLFFILMVKVVTAQTEKPKEYQTPESVVEAIFKFCTIEPGKPKEWADLKELIIDKGILVLRGGSVGFTAIDREEFAKVFKSDYEKYDLGKIGYDDRIIKIKTVEFGSIATCFVSFESKLINVSRPSKIGLNMFSLIKKDGRWWLASVIEEVVNKDRAIPESLFK